ncbi:MAG: hypothetical protein V7768_00255 [Dietzia cercidiphylli]
MNQQSAEQHMIQDARTKWLGELLSSVQIQETLRAQVRNSLEHFDEYLDEAFLNFSKRPPNGRLLLPLDMTLGRESTLDQFADGGSVYPLRVYLAEERVFINCGKRVSIGLLHSECRGILDFLRNAVPSLAEEEDPGGRGSPMFVLTPTSFDEP